MGSEPAKRGSRYAAFISYSCAADGGLAPAIQAGLQKFAKPWYRLRALRVFRDQTGLALTPELWGSIEAALRFSDHFLLLASPQAAKSKWVEQEVDWWLTHRSAAQVLIVVTEGDIAWDDATADFDWTRTNALPARLQKAFSKEPLYLDLRWARNSTHLSLLRPDFADAIARLSATLRRVPLDDLIGEHVRQHQKTLQLARRAVLVGSAVVLLALAATVYSLQARRMAGSLVRHQQAEASDLAAQSLSETLAEQAVNLRSSDADLAILLASEAVRIHPGEAAGSALRRTLFSQSLPIRTFSQTDGGNCFAAFQPNGTGLLTWSESGLRLHDPGTGRILREFPSDPEGVRTATFSADGRRICGLGNDDKVRIWETTTGQLLSEWPADGAAAALLSPDAARLLLLQEGIDGALWDTATRERVADIDFFSDRVFLIDRVQQAVFSSNGHQLAVLTRGGNATVLETQTGKALYELSDHKAPVNSVAFSGDDRWLVTASADATLRIWRADTGQPEAVLEHDAPLDYGVFSPDGRWVAARDDTQTVPIWEVATRKRIARLPLNSQETGPHIFNFSPDGTCVLTASYGWDFAVLWDTRTGQKVAELNAAEGDGPIRTMGFSADGTRAALGAVAGRARVHDTEVCGSATNLLAIAARRVPRPLTDDERQRYRIPVRP